MPLSRLASRIFPRAGWDGKEPAEEGVLWGRQFTDPSKQLIVFLFAVSLSDLYF